MIRLLAGEIPGPALCRSIVQIGFGVALQSTLLLGLGLLAGRVWRRRGPALSALIYRVTLVMVLLGGLLSVAVGGRLQPFWRLSLPPTSGSSVREPRSAPWPTAWSAAWSAGESAGDRLPRAAGSPKRLRPLLAGSRPGAAVPARPEGARPGRGSTPPGERAGWVYALIAGVWGAGALALLGWLLLCQLHLARLRRVSLPLEDGAAAAALADLCRSRGVRPPLLRSSPEVGSPLLTGHWRPAILLPAACERELDGPALRAILAHELAHLARRDCAWNLLARLTGAVGWVQPLLWLLCRRLQQASEEVCDQEVVRLEGDPCAYARCLLVLSERFLPSPAEALLGAGAVAFHSGLGRRIQQILAGPRPRPLSFCGRAAVLLGAGAAVALALFLLPAGAALPPAGAVAAGPGSAAGEQAGPSRRSPLASVPELAKPVTYTETRVPLGELVARVAADTGVTLTASAEVADEPVAVAVQALPARELLEQVAEMLDYQWHRTSGVLRVSYSVSDKDGPAFDFAGYGIRKTHYVRTAAFELYQDVASKRREQALREAALARAWQQLGEQIPQYVQMAAQPPAEIERLLDEEKRWGERNFQLPYAQRLAVDMRDRALRRQFLMAEQLASPVARGEAALLGRLTPPHWALLRQGQPLVFSTEPPHGELPLPDEIARALHGAQPRMGDETHYGSPERQKEERERRQELKTAWAEANGYQVRIVLDASRLQSDGELSLQASAIPLHGGRPASSPASLPANGAMLGMGVGPSYVFPGGIAEPDEKANAARRAALEQDPVFGAKKSLKVDLKPHRPEEPYWKGTWGLGEMFPDVARTYGVSLISDAYAGDRTTLRFSSATPIALDDLLDRLAGDRHGWDHRGRVVRFRYRAWPFARPQEVPMRLLRRWQALLDRDGALPLEEWLSAAATLTDAQMDTLHSIVLFRGPQAPFGPFDPRYALRLYMSLTPGQRQAFWQGRPLPFARMTPAQQTLFLASLRDQAQIRQGILAPGSEPAVAPGAALSLTRDRQVWIFEQHGSSTRIHYEPVPETPPAAAPTPASPGTRAAGGPASAAKSSVTRRTITTVTFRFQSASGVEENVPLYVAPPP